MRVSIRLGGALGQRYAAAFDEFTIRTESLLTADLPDSAALHSVLTRLRDLDIPMLDLHIDQEFDATASTADASIQFGPDLGRATPH